ncbi:MAG: DUF4926 domain-containing protein [Hormoscilla sp. GM7CHS1pb]|nr:DUF4926 domain-containing protein [Hormoscilla sp. GM7CHS1pb]
MKNFNLLDTVAVLNQIPRSRLTLVDDDCEDIDRALRSGGGPERAAISLPPGQVGTIVEVYKRAEGCQYLIEFSDQTGCEYAMAILKAEEFLVLHYELTAA